MAEPGRLDSVDALRGLTVAAMLLVNNPGDWSHVYPLLRHAEWNGCTPTDLVFPFFLFIVGVSIALGLVPRVEAGAAIAPLRRAVLLRAAKIIGLGLLLHLLAWGLLDREWFRPWGVLQRIGVCFGLAALLALHTGARGQWRTFVLLLAGYAMVLGYGGTEAWTNPASRLDTWLLGPHAYVLDATGRGHDPEGLLSTLGALATTVLGLRAGAWLREGHTRTMSLAALVLMVIAVFWDRALPFNKNLWTPSYVLWTGGWALLALRVAHGLVDRDGAAPLGRAFGVNAIAAYVGSSAMVIVLAGLGWLAPLYRVGFSGWLTPKVRPESASLAFALAFVGLWWLVVKAMDRAGWYVKV